MCPGYVLKAPLPVGMLPERVGWIVKEAIVFAMRHTCQASHIGEHCSIAIVPITPEQHVFVWKPMGSRVLANGGTSFAQYLPIPPVLVMATPALPPGVVCLMFVTAQTIPGTTHLRRAFLENAVLLKIGTTPPNQPGVEGLRSDVIWMITDLLARLLIPEAPR